MIRPISIVSDGYLSLSKRALVIAVAGYLNFGGETVVPANQLNSASYQEEYTGGGRGRSNLKDDDGEAISITLQAFIVCLQ